MKLRAARILASLLALLLLAACAEQSPGPAPADGQAPAKSPPASEDASGTGEPTLTVFCSLFYELPGNAAVVKFQEEILQRLNESRPEGFPRVEYYDPTGGDSSMDGRSAMERMGAELMSGRGPDLIISEITFDSAAGFDAEKRAGSGCFLDMAPFLQADESFSEEDCSAALLEAGRAGGAQYMLPIDYCVYTLLTSGDVLSASGLSKEQLSGSPEAYLAEIDRFLRRGTPCAFFATPDDPVPVLVEPLSFLWPDSAAMLEAMDGALFRQVVELIRRDIEGSAPLWNGGEWETIASTVNGTISLLANRTELIFQAMTRGELPADASFSTLPGVCLGSLVLEPRGGTILLDMENTCGGTTARIGSYGAINAHSARAQDAYDYLRQYMRAAAENLFTNHLFTVETSSVQLQYDAYWSDLVPNRAYLEERYGCSIPSMEEPETLYQQLAEHLDGITGAIISYTPYALVAEAFEPYLNGEATYDSCLAEAKFQLELYLSE